MRFAAHFRLSRLGLLLKRDVVMQYRTYLVALGALFAALFVANLASILTADSWSFHEVFFPLTLLLGGTVFTAASFQELNDAPGRAFYLSLPASQLEKLASKLIVSGPVYALVSLVLYSLFSVTVYGLSQAFFGLGHPLFDPFDPAVWFLVRVYLVTQALFLLGSIWFRSNAFLKTLLALFLLGLAFAAFLALCLYLLHWIVSFSGRAFIAFRIFDLILSGELEAPGTLLALAGAVDVGHRVFWALVAPVSWTIAYFRLRELEV